jgi:hypothetical protein
MNGESGPFYVKSHFAFGPVLPLRERARRAILLVRDPIDVMMSAWDYKHLTGEGNLHLLDEAAREPVFRQFVAHWISSGGQAYQWAGNWRDNVNSWLDQAEIPRLVIRYETLKARPAEELRRITDFLDRPLSPAQLAAAVEFGGVENMRNTRRARWRPVRTACSIEVNSPPDMPKDIASAAACIRTHTERCLTASSGFLPMPYSVQPLRKYGNIRKPESQLFWRRRGIHHATPASPIRRSGSKDGSGVTTLSLKLRIFPWKPLSSPPKPLNVPKETNASVDHSLKLGKSSGI